MNDGAWKIASGRLCVACLQEMAAEYIIEPAFHGWARGVCQRCGKDQKLTTFKRYTMSKRGLEKRGLLDTKEQDGLKHPWKGTVWCNPPYGRGIGQWVRRALFASVSGSTVVMLLPARTDTKWFHDYIYKRNNVEIRFIRGRLKFGGSKNSAPFPSMVVVFMPHD